MEWKPSNIVITLVLPPFLIGIALMMGLMWMGYFPIWWINRAVKTRKRWLKWRYIDVV